MSIFLHSYKIFTLSRALLLSLPTMLIVSSTLASDNVTLPTINFNSLYQTEWSENFPIEYVHTEGANKPAFEAWGLPKFYVADLNNDACDDILLDWADSAAEPIFFFGNKAGKLTPSDRLMGHTKVKTIREASFDDINGDGSTDIVGFSIAHEKPELGWNRDEFELIALGNSDGYFTVMKNRIPTASHAGIVADLNHDGQLDIMPFDTKQGKAKFQNLQISKNNEVIKGTLNSPKLSGYDILDADSGDLNNDGLTDVVLTVMPKPGDRKFKYVSPDDLKKKGSLLIYFGEDKTPFEKLKPLKMGEHWLTEKQWKTFLKSNGLNTTFNTSAIAAPSNADLIDIDGDGDLDILVGYYVSYKKSKTEPISEWLSSGFQIYENNAGNFTLATHKFTPIQTPNRDLQNPKGFILDFFFEDIDKDGKKDLLVSHLGSAHQTDAKMSASIFLNRDGIFLPASIQKDNLMPHLDRHEQSIVPGDFNCDGNRDLVTIAGSNKLHHKVFKLYLARSQSVSNQVKNTVTQRSKSDLRERVNCFMSDASSRKMEHLPTPNEITRLIMLALNNDAAKFSNSTLHELGLSKETIEAHGNSLLKLVNLEGAYDSYCIAPFEQPQLITALAKPAQATPQASSAFQSYQKHNIKTSNFQDYSLITSLSEEIVHIDGTDKPSRYLLNGEPVFKVIAKIRGNETNSLATSGRVDMQLFVSLNEFKPNKEIKRLLLSRDPATLFILDKESRENWRKISDKCNVNSEYIIIPMKDEFSTRASEFRCILDNIKTPMLSYFIQEMMYVGSKLELNLN